MKKTCKSILALLCLTALLCTGCAKQSPAVPAAEPAGRQSPAADPEPARDNTAAYAAYLDVLTENREAILGYDRQRGLVFDEATYEYQPAAAAAPVALCDVWGDETPELLYLAAATYDCYRYAATLHVRAWDGGALRELWDSDSLDAQAGGGMNYRLFQLEGDKSLWLYEIQYSGGVWETYTRLSAGGAMTPTFSCSHSGYPEEGPTPDDEWVWVDEWEKDGAACTQAEYEAAVPDEASQASGLLMRNALYAEYGPGVEPDETAYPHPETGAALTYDEAVAFLRAELGVEPPAVNERAFFASLPEFTFCSGAGAWSTDLSIRPDGGFYGVFHDANMGEDGPDYPYGTVYFCSFGGRFGDVKRVDDYTCSMRLLELESERTAGEEWIEDGVRYVSSLPYGLENADKVLVYLPGAWIRALPTEFVRWVGAPNAWTEQPVLLPFYGLYNVNGEEGFFGTPCSAVEADYAEDVLALFDEYDKFTADASGFATRVVFWAREPVSDFKVLALTAEALGEDGVAFSDRELYARDALTPERPLLVTASFPGDVPSLGISYADEDGARHRLAVNISGRDGALYLFDALFDADAVGGAAEKQRAVAK